VIEMDSTSGLISIMGGKWTTHRAMAEDTIHQVQQALGVPQTDSQTRNHVLYGGEHFTDDYWVRICRQYHVSENTARHLAGKFGTAAEDVLALGADNASLMQPILEEGGAIRAEVVYSVRNEMACTIEDVLARRLGMQFYSWYDAIEAAPVVGSVMAQELRWDEPFARESITSYVGKIKHLIDSAGLYQERPQSSVSRAAD